MRFSIVDTASGSDAMATAEFDRNSTLSGDPDIGIRQCGVTAIRSTLEVVPPPPPPAPPPLPPPCRSTYHGVSSSDGASESFVSSRYVQVSTAHSGCGSAATPGGVMMNQSAAAMMASPRQRLRRLQWSKLPASKVIGQTNVWTTSDRLFGAGTSESPVYRLDFDRMEQLFAVPQPPPMTSSTLSLSSSNAATLGTISPSGSPVAGAKYPLASGHSFGSTMTVDGRTASVTRLARRQIEEINLLDSRRSLNVNVFLRQFRSQTHAELVHMIARGDSEFFGAEKLRCLIRILPAEDERQSLTSFDGDRTRLGNAERFCLELMDVPKFEDRIEAMFFKEEFLQTIDKLKSSVEAFINTASQLKTNASLHEVLYMVLIAGNFLNAGGHAGDAVGFRLSSLPSLVELRANKPRMTLLHYVAMEAEEKKPDLLSFTEQLPRLKEASECPVESVKADVFSLTERLESVTARVGFLDQVFQRAITSFLRTARVELDSVRMKMAEVDALRDELAVYYCEDEATFQLDDAFKIWDSFCDKFRRSVKENNERRLQDEKAEQRKKQMEQRMKSLDECFPRRSSLDPSRDSTSEHTDGADLVGALLSGATSGSGRVRTRSRSVTDNTGYQPSIRHRDVIQLPVEDQRSPSTIAIINKQPNDTDLKASDRRRPTGTGNEVGHADMPATTKGSIGSCWSAAVARQQERSASVKSYRLTSSFDDGCCNRERVATGSAASRLQPIDVANNETLVAREHEIGNVVSPAPAIVAEVVDRLGDERPGSAVQRQQYAEKWQQLNVGAKPTVKSGGGRSDEKTALSGEPQPQENSRRTLVVLGEQPRSRPNNRATVTSSTSSAAAQDVRERSKTRRMSSDSTDTAKNANASVESPKPGSGGGVTRLRHDNPASRGSRMAPSPAIKTTAAPVVIGDIANRRVELTMRPNSSRTAPQTLVNSSQQKIVQAATPLQQRRSFGSSASSSAPVGVRLTQPLRGSSAGQPTATAVTARRLIAVTTGPTAALSAAATSPLDRRGSVGKTATSQQRELTTRLSQPKTSTYGRRSSESSVLAYRSEDESPPVANCRQLTTPTVSQSSTSRPSSRTDESRAAVRRTSPLRRPSDNGVASSRPSSASTDAKSKSLETALAVAAEKRKDLRRRQAITPQGVADSTKSVVQQPVVDSDNATSAAIGTASKGLPSSLSTDRRVASSRNGYLSLTTSAAAKSFNVAVGRRSSQDTSTPVASGRRGGRDGEGNQARSTSTGRSTPLSSGVASRRRGSNASTASTDTASRQSTERLDCDDETSSTSSRRTASDCSMKVASRASTFQTSAAASRAASRGQTTAVGRERSSSTTGVGVVCNRLRCKPQPQQPMTNNGC